MAKILIVNTPGLLNKGGMAAVIGGLASLRESLPDAQITVLCHHCRDDWDTLQMICNRFGVQMRKHPWLREHDSKILQILISSIPAFLMLLLCVWGRIARKLRLPSKGVFNENDIILGLDIDTLHDHYGIFFPAWTLYNLMLGVVAGKPVVVWGAGIGRFKRKITELMAKFVLTKMNLIITREEVSKEYIQAIGITRPRIEATADHAFMMEPSPPERINEILEIEQIRKGEKPLVAVAPSQLIHQYAFPSVSDKIEKYRMHVGVMAEIVDYLVEKLDADILLIAHVTIRSEDDRLISQQISKCVKNAERVKMLYGDYMADELKGIISRCDMLIGERMHPMIAATSMGVPTVAVIYGEKAYGILGDMMEQSEYMVEIVKYNPAQLLQKLKASIDKVWADRVSIRAALKERSGITKERARLNGILVRELVEKKRLN